MVAIYFNSTSCGGCKKTTPIVQGLIDKGYPITIITDDWKACRKHRVKALPTIIFLDRTGGDEVSRLTGGQITQEAIIKVLGERNPSNTLI